jgi:sporulation integral membrane protein YtvI
MPKFPYFAEIILAYLFGNSNPQNLQFLQRRIFVNQNQLQRLFSLLAVGGFLFFGGKYIFPLIFPFLLGFLLAYMAEPGVRRLEKRLSRGVAAAVSVSFLLVIIFLVFAVLGGLLVRGLKNLPDLEAAARDSSRTLERFLLGLAARSPAGLRNILSRGVLGLFDDGGSLWEMGFHQLPRMLTGVLSHLPGGAIALCTAVVSAYLISGRMPKLVSMVPERWKSRLLPTLRNIRTAVGGWLKAQGKLAGLTFLLCCGGFFLLGIPYAPVWAAVVALVDAVPLLGSGLVLVPWSLVSFLQGDSGKGVGLLVTFGAAFLLRTVLEPRLVGRQMGLDPLVTLAALYLGYQLGGFWGMILSPILAVTAMELTK